MKFTFLGTGTSQGIPVIGSNHPVCHSKDPRDKRLRVSASIEWGASTFVIDCGPDFRQQMLRSPLSRKLPQATKEHPALSAILFTHEHADHVAGLDDIRPFVFRQGALPIYAHKRVLDTLRERFAYIFETENRYPGAPSVQTYEVKSTSSFSAGGKEIIPVEVYHGSLQIFGYRFGNLAYLTDVKTIVEEELKKLRNLDILVINALHFEEHSTHLNVEEALALVEELQPKKTYFTHISHLMGFHEDVEKQLPENVYLAYDGLTLTL